jgi:asparagine synthase (glutamine-hydrolysing)
MTENTHSVDVYRDDETVVVLAGRPWRLDQPAHGAPLSAAMLARQFMSEGTSLLSKLGGAFALSLVRPQEGEAVLAIDRFSVENLFYVLNGPELAWSTRLAQLAAHPLVACRVTPQAVFEYLYFHCVPGPGTIHAGVQRLLPGHYLHHRAGQTVVQAHWKPQYRALNTAEQIPAPATLPGVIEAAVARHELPGPQACFLSGGLDSSTVTGLAAKRHPGEVTAFTIGFRAPGYDEMEYARTVARHFNVRHIDYYVTPEDIVDSLPALVSAFDGPFGNASAVPTYFCARLAREHGFSTLLAGDGGDELFGGNSRYGAQLIFEHYQKLPAVLRTGLLEPLGRSLPDWARRGIAGKAASYIRQASMPLPDRLMNWNLLNWITPGTFLSGDFLAGVDQTLPLRRLREMYELTQDVATVDRLLHLDLRLALADSDLPKVRRMAAHAGVDVGFPLLDEAVFDYAASLPATAKVSSRTLRPAFREAFADFLPAETLGKGKQGFGLPFGLWLREDAGLRDFASSQLEALETRGILRRGFRADFLSGRLQAHPAYYGVLVWILMTLALWLDSSPARLQA